MKKIMIVVLLLGLVIMVGCQLDKKNDPVKVEMFQLIVNDKYDEALKIAKETYDGEELDDVIEWLNEQDHGMKINRRENEKRDRELREKYDPSSRLEIQSERNYEIRGKYIYVSGHVKNVSDNDINYFEVIVKFVDEDGNVLDSDYTNDSLKLGSGEMRSFEIMHKWNDDFKKCRLSIGNVR